MDFSDLFSSDSLGAIGSTLGLIGQGVGAVTGTRNATNLRNENQGALTSLQQLYSPDSPYAQMLRQQLARQDAARGRRSQYGVRETELAAKLAQNQASVLNSPQYQQLMQGANRGVYGTALGALGYNQTAPQQNSIVGAASKLNNLRKLYNYGQGLYNLGLSGPAELGGAASALEGGFGSFGGAGGLAGSGAELGSNLGIGGIFGPASDFGAGAMSATNSADALGSLSSLFGGGGGEAAGATSGLGDLFSGIGSSLGFDTGAAGSAAAGSTAGAGSGAGAGGAGSLGALGFAAPLALFAGGMMLASGGITTPTEQANTMRAQAGQSSSDLYNNFVNAAPGTSIANTYGLLPWDFEHPEGPTQSWEQYAQSLPQRSQVAGQFSADDLSGAKQYYDWATQNKDNIYNALDQAQNQWSMWGRDGG